MKDEYDFSKGKRGAVISAPGKTRITIRLDDDVLEWFRGQVGDTGGNYQTTINDALREHIAREREPLEGTLRRVIREELQRAAAAQPAIRRLSGRTPRRPERPSAPEPRSRSARGAR
jgi:hypothetical protein